MSQSKTRPETVECTDGQQPLDSDAGGGTGGTKHGEVKTYGTGTGDGAQKVGPRDDHGKPEKRGTGAGGSEQQVGPRDVERRASAQGVGTGGGSQKGGPLRKDKTRRSDR